jgi:hypothetical protein
MSGGGPAGPVLAVFQVLYVAVRIFAAAAGALVGWLVTGFAVRVLVRLAFHRPVPRPVLFLARVVGAVLIGLLVYYYLHPGGSGGWGLGGGGFGLGGGGTGPGKGGAGGTGIQATTRTTAAEPGTAKSTDRATTAKTRPPDTLTIELLGGSRYKKDRRYYLVDGREPAKTLDEVEESLKRNKGRYRKLEIVITPESVASVHPAVTGLEELAQQHHLTSVLRIVRPPAEGAAK